MDEHGRVWTSIGEHGRACASIDEHARVWTSMDEHGRAWTSVGEYGRACASIDEYWLSIFQQPAWQHESVGVGVEIALDQDYWCAFVATARSQVTEASQEIGQAARSRSLG